jgi:hypothetical protein
MIFPSFSMEKLQSAALTMPSLSHLTSCTPTISNLYLTNSLAAVIVTLTYAGSSHSIYQISCPFSIAYVIPKDQSRPVANVSISQQGKFLWRRVIRASPTQKLEDHPLLAVCDCLFNIFAAKGELHHYLYFKNSYTKA